MSRVQSVFERLGFKKNMSECYNDQHIMYEKSVQDGSDIFKVEFKDGFVVYTNLTNKAIVMYSDLVKAIYLQMEELGWS